MADLSEVLFPKAGVGGEAGLPFSGFLQAHDPKVAGPQPAQLRSKGGFYCIGKWLADPVAGATVTGWVEGPGGPRKDGDFVPSGDALVKKVEAAWGIPAGRGWVLHFHDIDDTHYHGQFVRLHVVARGGGHTDPERQIRIGWHVRDPRGPHRIEGTVQYPTAGLTVARTFAAIGTMDPPNGMLSGTLSNPNAPSVIWGTPMGMPAGSPWQIQFAVPDNWGSGADTTLVVQMMDSGGYSYLNPVTFKLA